MTWKERARMKVVLCRVTGKMYLLPKNKTKQNQTQNRNPPQQQNPKPKTQIPRIGNGEKLVSSCETVPRVFLRKSIAVKARGRLQMKQTLEAELMAVGRWTMTEHLY